MSEGNNQETQSRSTTIQIDPEIQGRLKITENDIQSYNAEKRNEEEFLLKMENEGRGYLRSYSAWPDNREIRVKEFVIRPLTPLVCDVPEEAMAFLQQNRDSISEDKQQITEKGLKSFIVGMEKEALDKLSLREAGQGASFWRRLYWKTVINASDVTTEGGIGADESIQIKLGNAIDSPRERVEMGEFLQDKINRRKEATQQTPNPHIIPPEQRTPPEYAADDPRRANVGGQEEHPADLRPAPPQDSEPQV